MTDAAMLGPIGTLGDHAVNYGHLGLDVFPVNPADKTPLVSQYQATTDPEQIARWWHRWPTALIGHRIAPTMLLTDIDPRHNGHLVWQELREAIGPTLWPDTRAHRSGRGDNGGHSWWQHPGGKLNIGGLNEWARERQLGEAHGRRWSAGIDLLHADHRYTILPPSPHPLTGDPYRWIEGRGLQVDPAPMPELLAELVTVPDLEQIRATTTGLGLGLELDSIADWYTASHSWTRLLPAHGWTLIDGNGDDDGSTWRHPAATTPTSATIRHRCLFVYSPNTPFEPTEAGDPHGVTLFAAYAELEHHGDMSAAASAARDMRAPAPAPVTSPSSTPPPAPLEAGPLEADYDLEPEPAGPQPIDWHTFWNQEHPGEDWLVEPIWPRGRQVALYATAKTGKSLVTIEMVAALATGRPVLQQPAGEPAHVLYLDLEMTEADLHDRLTDLGYGPDTDLTHLHYYLLPSLPPLDTAAGGVALVELAERHAATAVVVDTMARVVAGDENDADTYRGFYRHTGLHLKARGISVIRLDHGGKDTTKGQRGSSSKADDVDIVWHLTGKNPSFTLTRDMSRVSWGPETVNIRRDIDPQLRHVITDKPAYAAGTADVATEMLRIGITSADSQTAAAKQYRAAGGKGSQSVLRDAHRYLAELEARNLDGLVGDEDTF